MDARVGPAFLPAIEIRLHFLEQECKRLRDTFSHGDALDEQALPIANLQCFARNLVGLRQRFRAGA